MAKFPRSSHDAKVADKETYVHQFPAAVLVLVLSATIAIAQTASAATAGDANGKPGAQRVEFETMTWPEVKSALANGKTTALFYTGGTEQRGPQNANGGHNLMAKAVVKAIALKLGNAIAMPVLPYTPNEATAQLPGTIGLTNDILAAVLERLSEQAIVTGFRNIVLMGDHGGGQPDVYRNVAKKLDEKYASQGIRVLYCDDVYAKANDEFEGWLAAHGQPGSLHGGIADTSMMLYLGGDTWVRRGLISTALGDPIPPAGEPPALKVNNGIIGDARGSSAALGKKAFDMKVADAVTQIRALLGAH
jgi:creatinine amidohydrolase